MLVASKLQINFSLRYLSPKVKLVKLFLLKTSVYKLFKNIYRQRSENCARYGGGELVATRHHDNTVVCEGDAIGETTEFVFSKSIFCEILREAWYSSGFADIDM